MIVMILVISVVTYNIMAQMVSKPVGRLNEKISRITAGDFTVDIPEGGSDEIGFMNNNMRQFVSQMRGTLDQIKTETGKLSNEAANSKDVDDSASTVSASASAIEDYVKNFKI